MKHVAPIFSLIFALPALGQYNYNYDAIANAKEKPPLRQTVGGVMSESHRMYTTLTAATNQTYAAYEAQQARNRANNPPPSTNTYCGSSDTCFQVVKTYKDETTIRCIKGAPYKIGQEYKICGPNSKGNYASGCGITNAFAYHYTFKKAGNIACD